MIQFVRSLVVLAHLAVCGSGAVAQDPKSETASAPHISLANASRVRLIREIPRDVRRIVWGPGIGRVSLLGWETSVDVRDIQSFQPEKTLAGGRSLIAFAVTSDGLTSAWLENSDRVELRNDHNRNVLILETGNPQPTPVFSPNGKILATGGYGTLARLWDSTTGKLIRSLDAGPSVGGLTPAFSPDSRLVAIGNRNAETSIFEVTTGNLVHILPRAMTQELRFSPDGRSLAVAYVDGSIGLWDVASGKLLHIRTGVAKEVYALDWSRAGDVLATAGLEGRICLWDARDLTVLKEFKAPEWVIQVRFNPEGNRLFTCGGTALPSAKRSVVIWGLPD